MEHRTGHPTFLMQMQNFKDLLDVKFCQMRPVLQWGHGLVRENINIQCFSLMKEIKSLMLISLHLGIIIRILWVA